MSDPIPRDRLEVARRATRFQCLWILNHVLTRAMHHDPALTIEVVATRLGWAPEHLEGKLSGVHDLKLDDIASIPIAIDGTVIEPRLTPIYPPPDTERTPCR